MAGMTIVFPYHNKVQISLVSVMFFTKRKRGDGGKQWTGYTDLFQKMIKENPSYKKL